MPTSTITESNPSETVLSEEFIQDAFHSYLKSSLTQAKIEGLLPTNVLSSAEGDLMITGPALCLYFAALRSTTEPPSVPLPKRSKGSSPPLQLSQDNCPPTFRPFWIVWSHTVPEIQALVPEYQHDLARVICGLPPIASPLNPRLNGIAADLRAVAIEISMRRSFQDRYANDLQAALDAGSGGRKKVKASFVPPPVYDSPPATRPSPSPSPSTASFSPIPPALHSPTPTILTPDSPAIEFIRETLYAALADVIERMPPLRRLLRSDPSRAYFASVAFAILDVATTSVTHPELQTKGLADVLPNSESGDHEATIYGVLGQTLTLSKCPPDLRPFMKELCAIGQAARDMEEEDSVATVHALEREREPPRPRLERVRDILEGGVGHAFNSGSTHRHSSRRSSAQGHDSRSTDPRRRTTSTENRAVAFANRINALALGMTKLRAFRERQDVVFKLLLIEEMRRAGDPPNGLPGIIRENCALHARAAEDGMQTLVAQQTAPSLFIVTVSSVRRHVDCIFIERFLKVRYVVGVLDVHGKYAHTDVTTVAASIALVHTTSTWTSRAMHPGCKRNPNGHEPDARPDSAVLPPEDLIWMKSSQRTTITPPTLLDADGVLRTDESLFRAHRVSDTTTYSTTPTLLESNPYHGSVMAKPKNLKEYTRISGVQLDDERRHIRSIISTIAESPVPRPRLPAPSCMRDVYSKTLAQRVLFVLLTTTFGGLLGFVGQALGGAILHTAWAGHSVCIEHPRVVFDEWAAMYAGALGGALLGVFIGAATVVYAVYVRRRCQESAADGESPTVQHVLKMLPEIARPFVVRTSLCLAELAAHVVFGVAAGALGSAIWMCERIHQANMGPEISRAAKAGLVGTLLVALVVEAAVAFARILADIV
ncbi:hypothetical protein IEO21_06359 [Rhodonia placenta]|uniref:Uncharacterized protein n=1 Tax=Rhodonia placenta TaxID=104341 RepID=A0A8H7U182_9APHY|nr:hypothetical protein IEO21_06359 [Postia placenta]